MDQTMDKSFCYFAWGAMFLITAILGFFPAEHDFANICMIMSGVSFFVPPMLLVMKGDKTDAKRVFAISLASLVGTAVMIMVSVRLASGSRLLGNILHAVLVVVSAPMFCCQIWALSLFLWACLMIAALRKSRA